MARTITCIQCDLCIVYDIDGAVVHYWCGHVEHDDCYFDHHPHNLVCLICGDRSDFLVFKYVEKIVLSGFYELVILILLQ
jgi:hypothetical protein